MFTVTKERVRAAYTFLRVLPPFNRWKLPEPNDVHFVVFRSNTLLGEYKKRRYGHCIRIETECHNLLRLLMTMAHEMTHLYQQKSGLRRKADEYEDDWHDDKFLPLARHVCRRLGLRLRRFL